MISQRSTKTVALMALLVVSDSTAVIIAVRHDSVHLSRILNEDWYPADKTEMIQTLYEARPDERGLIRTPNQANFSY